MQVLENMGWGSTSKPVEAKVPPGLTKDSQLNDSVWKFYSPPDEEVSPEVDIIFFHGLQVDNYEEAFWKTWLALNEDQVVWPKDWLSKKLPRARIFSVSYNSSATRIEGQHDMYILEENLVQDIINFDHGIGQKCPVFLVGHCLGGIVIKAFILYANHRKDLVERPKEIEQSIEWNRIKGFLDNFKGAFFYATPLGGSPEIEKFASRLKNPSDILRLLKTLDKVTARTNEEFRMRRVQGNARIFGLAEGLPTISLGFHGQVVPEASARHDVDEFYTHARGDHFTICKARGIDDSTVIGKLTQFITNTLPSRTITSIR